MDAWVAEHGPRLARLARGLLGDPGEAADAVQDAFLSAWKARGRLRPDSDVGAWLATLCLNHCRMRLRRRGRERRALERREPPATARTEAPAEAAERARALDEALAGLPEREREAFLLIAVEGQSSVLAAETMGCTPGAARVHLGRARLALAGKLERFLLP